MRTIGLWLVVMLLSPFSSPEGTIVTSAKNNPVFKFHLPSSCPDFFKAKKKKIPENYDTASLKQTDWYAEAIKNIAAQEYEINYSSEAKKYSSPNRQQNLRAFYTGDQFTLLPRNDSADKWKLNLQLKDIYADAHKWFAPAGNPVVIKNGSQIQFNHNNEFTVEYVNTKEGVRQNFIIQKEPVSKTKTINIKLQANKGWYINKANDKELHFAKPESGELSKKITYNDLKVWDADNKELAARFVVNKNHSAFNIEVNTTDATYPITIDPLNTTAAAMVHSNQASAYMGWSVASAGDVNGDGYSDVIAGTPNFDLGQPNEGAAFVYHGSATGISTVAAAMVHSGQAYAFVGVSVASAGDVNNDGYSDIIVGADGYDNPEIDEGAAFVYHGSPTGISTTAAATVQSNNTGARMGHSVASAGDVNGDGFSDVIVGAPYYNNGSIDEGAFFVYRGSPSGIIISAMTMIESNLTYDYMGISVASAGDVNGDGYSDVIVGSYGYFNGSVQGGGARIYRGSAGGIVFMNMVVGTQHQARLGSSVASAGDVNGDGYSDIIVGADRYDNPQIDEGAAFIYYGSASGINTTAAAMVESNQAYAYMGCSVASAGDVNGDGYSDVIVGAWQFGMGFSYEGAAFVYFGSATGISTTAAAIVHSNQLNAYMGQSVASAGDVNGDGYSDIIVGAYNYNSGQAGEGAAFVYHGSADGINTTANAMMESNQASANMGFSVASAGDVNGDGYSDVIVGAHYYDNGETDEGAAFVYHGSSAGISTTAAAIVESNQASAQMGYSVACAGDVNGDGYSDVIVGANLYDNGQADEGAAFIYHGSAGGISTTAATIVESNQVSALMGVSVASAGDVNGDGYSDVIVGAFQYDNGQTDEGAAFIYQGSASGISTTVAAIVESNQAGALMGVSVASAGDINGDGYSDVIVGAFYYDNVQTDEGAAFVYHGSATGINTTASATVESNQANAYMGRSVAAAGDVNGDGYGDIIVGAYGYTNVQSSEGAAFVYHGSATGINTTAAATVESNQANAYMGISVASAGDVNGDGYSDVIVGAFQYDNGQTDEGAAFIYHGSASGISTTAAALVESNQVSACMGVSVASAGDVNGDGYSDVIVGAYMYDNGLTDEGAAFVYYGNSPGNNLRNNLRLYNSDLVTPIQQSNMADPNLFGAGLYAKSFIGRQKGRLVWQTVKNGNPFSGIPITNSTLFTAQTAIDSIIDLTGKELKHQIAKQTPTKATYIRARVKYDKVTAITGQVYGPWRYPEDFMRGRRDVGSVALPLKFIFFTVVKQDNTALLKWITVDEEPGVIFEVQHSTDGVHFTTLASINGRNQARNEYEWLHTVPAKGNNFYRIRAVENQKELFTATKKLNFIDAVVISIFPNPAIVNQALKVESIAIRLNQAVKISFTNSAGQIVWQKEIMPAADGMLTFNIPALPGGAYLLLVQAGQWTGSKTTIVTDQ